MPDSEPATPFIPPRPDLGTPLGSSPAVLPSVIPMSPSQVGAASKNRHIQYSPPFNTALSLRAHPLQSRTRSSLPTQVHPLSRPPWRPLDPITCRQFNCQRMLTITIRTLRRVIHRVIHLDRRTTLLVYLQNG